MPLKKSVLSLVVFAIVFFTRTNAQVVSLYNLFDVNNSGFVPASGTITGTRVLADNATWVTFPSLINSSVSAGTGISITGTGPVTISNTGVTSVGLNMPAAFTVTNSPVTTTGILTVTGAGTTNQYIKGDGTLGTYALSTLTDATITTPTNGQILQYNSATSRWANWTPAYLTAVDTGNITGFYLKVRGLLSTTAPLSYNNTTGVFSLGYDNTTIKVNGTNQLYAANTTALWNANQLQGRAISATAPTNGQVLTWNNTNNDWEPANSSSGGGSTGWLLTGNSGTTAGTNFVGTTDNQDLVFKTNNTESGRLSVYQLSTSYGISASAIYQATSIGNAAVASGNGGISLGYQSNSGFEGTALGATSQATQNNTTAAGFQALATNQNATALGSTANASGQNATAVGYGATATGYEGTVIGTVAKATQNYATALGYNAQATAINATAIGYNVTANTANTVILGNGTNVGIGTSAPNNKLEITQGTNGNSGLRLTNFPNISLLGTNANGDVIAASSSAIPNIYTSDGTIQANRTVNQNGKTLTFTNANTVNAFSVDGTTFSVDGANNRVGIGTSTPANAVEISAASDPLKLDGLQTGSSSDYYLTVNSSGVVRQYSSPSAVVTSSNFSGGTAGSGSSIQFAPNTNYLTVNAGDIIVIEANLMVYATGGTNQNNGSGGDFVTINPVISGTANVTWSTGNTTPKTVTNYAPAINRGPYMAGTYSGANSYPGASPTNYIEYGTVTTGGTLRAYLQGNFTTDDAWSYNNAVLVIRKN